MKNRSILVILIAFVCIFIVSCGKGSQGDGRTDIELQSGTDGLTFEFMDGFPEEVFEEGRIYATFELRNEGVYDIEDGIVVLSLEKDFLNIDSWELPELFKQDSDEIVSFEELKGKSLSNTRGEKQVISAILRAKEVDETRNKIESRVILNACYQYNTILSETICIDTDPNDLKAAQKTCKAKDISSSGQGAPIVITNVEQEIVPADYSDRVKVQFTIHAKNKGDGLIIDNDRYKEVCAGDGIKEEDYLSTLICHEKTDFTEIKPVLDVLMNSLG